MRNATRDGLISAAKELISERGVEATSPGAILERSGAGKGSFYHFFRGKTNLAAIAIGELAAELCSFADQSLSAELNPGVGGVDRIVAYLTAPRNALAGCRIGRLAQEESVVRQSALREPMQRFFAHLRELLRAALVDAQRDGTLDPSLDEFAVAAALIAALQGAYVYARAFDDASYMDAAAGGMVQMLNGLRASWSRQ